MIKMSDDGEDFEEDDYEEDEDPELDWEDDEE